MAKSGLLPAKPRNTREAAADAWVSGGHISTPAPLSERQSSSEPSVRMTFDLPKSLHHRVRLRCAEDGTKMATVIRQMLEERFPVEK